MTISRRKFVQNCTLGAIAIASAPIAGCLATKSVTPKNGPTGSRLSLDQDWLFGGKFEPGQLVGTSPFNLEECGGDGAVWVKTIQDKVGTITLEATHSLPGTKKIDILLTAGKQTPFKI